MSDNFDAVNKAFSKQSPKFDAEDFANPVLSDLREQVYAHVDRVIKPNSSILELNAGTGIDAAHFVSQGHRVLATDLAAGMIEQLQNRINKYQLQDQLSCRQLSFNRLNELEGNQFDFVFSNSGGLNCIRDLNEVTRHLAPLLKPGAHVTWVIMPNIYLWEWLGIFKGRFSTAFRRLHRNGVMAHLEGEYFRTYYHSVKNIREAFDNRFQFIALEGLAALSPPPHRPDFPTKHPHLYRTLRKFDGVVKDHFPFNRWADHIIVTFRYDP